MSENSISGSYVTEGREAGSRALRRRGTRSGLSYGGDTANGEARSRSKVVTQPAQPVGGAKDAVDAQNAALLAAKQVQLDQVVNRHDDLVRELFHMENFTMMLSYDPAEAKTDRTAYKAKYDLIDKAAPTAGPSRQTRGRLNERRQILANAAISTPLPTPSPQRKPKPKVSRKAEIMETLASVSSYKGKGKEKDVPESEPQPAVVMHTQEPKIPEPLSAPVGNGDREVYVNRKSDKKSVPSKPAIIPEPAESITAPNLGGGNGNIRAAQRKSDRNVAQTRSTVEQTQTGSPTEPPPVPPIESDEPPGLVKRLSRKANGHTRHSVATSVDGLSTKLSATTNGINGHAPCPPVPPDESISVGLQQRRSGRLKAPIPPPPRPPPTTTPRIKLRFSTENKSSLHEPPSDIVSLPLPPSSRPPLTPAPTQSFISPSPSPIKFGLPRIKLIVRRPPPTLTNPLQRPPEPRYNHSLHRFLSSYTMLDEEDVSASTLAEQASDEAKLRERVEKFRKEGRFFLDTDGTAPEDITYSGPTHVKTDAWSHIVEAVVERGKTKPKKSLAMQITSQIASKVHAYFEVLEQRKNKARDLEERKLRALAKSTMKLVSAEWKKALYHIREKQRQEQEEEDRRLGHAHLDAILDQSGQLLETQQGDLSRGDIFGSRSRSGSFGGFDDQDDEGEDKVDEDEQTDEEDEDEGEDEPGIETLITGPLPNEGEEIRDGSLIEESSPMTRSKTPGSNHPEEDQDLSTILLFDGESQDVDMRTERSSDGAFDALFNLDSKLSSQRRPRTQDLFLADDILLDESSQPESLDEPPQEGSSAAPVNLEATPELLANDVIDHELGFFSQSHETEDLSHSQPESDADQSTQILDDQASTQDQHDLSAYTDQVYVPMVDENPEQEMPVGIEGEREEENDVEEQDKEVDLESQIPAYLRPFAVVPVDWDPETKVTPPLLLRGVLRPYQQSGLEWLASLHSNRLNGILADEMGLGKTIQTIALLAHLACDRGIWGPHLIVVPTSVLLNWEMEFKKFLPGFKVLSYHGTTKRRKELRQGWNDKFHFNVCITSYTLASRDAHIFKRKPWYYMILDEAHMIKNFKSQRWNILLMFRSHRRLLLTGTPLQNNLTELWSLLQFLMSGSNFANLKEFAEWFSNPLEKAIEMGNINDDETMQRVSKLHTVLRPYLLRRLKRDVEKELPSKFEHLTLCPLSKRQRFLYDEFMSRAQTRDALDSGVYQKIANVLMQLRKVCNHPDLFEVHPIATSFAMSRSAIADFEIKELLVRRRFLMEEDESLDATTSMPYYGETVGEPPPKDTRTIAGFRKYSEYAQRARTIARWAHIGYLNKLRCSHMPIIPEGLIVKLSQIRKPILPFSHVETRFDHLDRVDQVNKLSSRIPPELKKWLP
ncbi:SNF2 family N-terminal domain-containing protein [Gymnopilus junonius]|uniref:DNA helicase n=1 Tax=Gymnopilus junonius TaxID=109634 RepID=A0A9P5P0R5_GYMJU|nr:SNF2 family N-terminal domain-containing protein [Gymnopilus junonius]